MGSQKSENGLTRELTFARKKETFKEGRQKRCRIVSLLSVSTYVGLDLGLHSITLLGKTAACISQSRDKI